MNENDTVRANSEPRRREPWPLDDCIRWIEWRVRELTIKSGVYFDERGRWLIEQTAMGGRKLALGDEVADYAVWLLKARDGLSWHQIAYRFFPTANETEIEKCESRVRRAYARVEKHHPGSEAYVPEKRSERDEMLLDAVMIGVIPIYVSSSLDHTGEDSVGRSSEIVSGC